METVSRKLLCTVVQCVRSAAGSAAIIWRALLELPLFSWKSSSALSRDAPADEVCGTVCSEFLGSVVCFAHLHHCMSNSISATCPGPVLDVWLLHALEAPPACGPVHGISGQRRCRYRARVRSERQCFDRLCVKGEAPFRACNISTGSLLCFTKPLVQMQVVMTAKMLH